jgi:hypothetical protein
MHIQQITLTKVLPARGSNRTAWNYDLDGRPFGQVWTFKAKGESHLFHAKPLKGEYRFFAEFTDADTYMRGCM